MRYSPMIENNVQEGLHANKSLDDISMIILLTENGGILPSLCEKSIDEKPHVVYTSF